MLTDADIEFMRQTRKEVVSNRQRDITLIWDVDGEEDPWTGEPIGPSTDSKVVKSVVTEITSMAVADRQIINGADVMEGDLWFSVDIENVLGIDDAISSVRHDDKDYTVIAKDKKGIGVRNRVEFLGRRTI